jgi:hypothetical protein
MVTLLNLQKQIYTYQLQLLGEIAARGTGGTQHQYRNGGISDSLRLARGGAILDMLIWRVAQRPAEPA